MNSQPKNNQGKYHLLILFLIPINMVAWFLPESYLVGIGVSLVSLGITYFFLFRAKGA